MSNMHIAVRWRCPGFVCKAFSTLIKNYCTASISIWFYFRKGLEECCLSRSSFPSQSQMYSHLAHSSGSRMSRRREKHLPQSSAALETQALQRPNPPCMLASLHPGCNCTWSSGREKKLRLQVPEGGRVNISPTWGVCLREQVCSF